jgi:hypothetical protein
LRSLGGRFSGASPVPEYLRLIRRRHHPEGMIPSTSAPNSSQKDDERVLPGAYVRCMFRRTVQLQADPMTEWRDASKRVVRAYKAWCAASRPDRHALYVSFLDALKHEERAARNVQHDASQPAPEQPYLRRRDSR